MAMGTFEALLSSGSDWGVSIFTKSRKTVPQNIPNVHQTSAGLEHNVAGDSILLRNGRVVWYSINRRGVQWVVVHREEMGP